MATLCCVVCANSIRPGVYKILCPACKLQLESVVGKRRELKCQSCTLTEHLLDSEYAEVHRRALIKAYADMEQARHKAEKSLSVAQSRKVSMEERIDRNDLDRFNRIAKSIEQKLEVQDTKLAQITEENFLASELWIRNMKARLASVYQACRANNNTSLGAIARVAGNITIISSMEDLFRTMEATLEKTVVESGVRPDSGKEASQKDSIFALVRTSFLEIVEKTILLFKSRINIAAILNSIALAKNVFVGHADMFRIHTLQNGVYVLPSVLVLPPNTTLGGIMQKSHSQSTEQKTSTKFEARMIQALTPKKKHFSVIRGTIVLTDDNTIFNLYIIGRVYIAGKNVTIINCTVESDSAYCSALSDVKYEPVPTSPLVQRDYSLSAAVHKLTSSARMRSVLGKAGCPSVSEVARSLAGNGVAMEKEQLEWLEKDMSTINPCVAVINRSTNVFIVKSKINSNSVVNLSFDQSSRSVYNGVYLFVGPNSPLYATHKSELYIHDSSIFCARTSSSAMISNFQSARHSPVMLPYAQLNSNSFISDINRRVVCPVSADLTTAIATATITPTITAAAATATGTVTDTAIGTGTFMTANDLATPGKSVAAADKDAQFLCMFTPQQFVSNRDTVMQSSLITIEGGSHVTMNNSSVFNAFTGLSMLNGSIHMNTCVINNNCIGALFTSNAYDSRLVYTVFGENGIGNMLVGLRNTIALYLSRYEMNSVCGLLIANTNINTSINFKTIVVDGNGKYPSSDGGSACKEDSIISASTNSETGNSALSPLRSPLSVPSSVCRSTGKGFFNTLSLRSSLTLSRTSGLPSATKLPDHHCIFVGKCDFQASNATCLAIVEERGRGSSSHVTSGIVLHSNRIEVSKTRLSKNPVILQGEYASRWSEKIHGSNWIIPLAAPEVYTLFISPDAVPLLSCPLTSKLV